MTGGGAQIPLFSEGATWAYGAALRDAWQAPSVEERVRQSVAAMEDLLRSAVAEGAAALGGPPGRFELLHDPEQGFIQMVHCYGQGHATPPHDHGPAWVVYGVLAGEVEIATYRRREGDADRVEQASSRLFSPGVVQGYLPGEIHSTRTEAETGAIVLRLLSQDLAPLPRHRFSWDAIVV